MDIYTFVFPSPRGGELILPDTIQGVLSQPFPSPRGGELIQKDLIIQDLRSRFRPLAGVS